MIAAVRFVSYWGVVVLVVALAAALYGAYHHGESVTDARWQLKWADQQALQTKVLAAATTANRAEEQRRQAAVSQVENDARKQAKMVVADGAVADATGERVREQAGKLAASASCAASNTGVAERSKAAARAAMVLSDLFQRADKRAGELAKAYDAAELAGKACEGTYKSISPKGGWHERRL